MLVSKNGKICVTLNPGPTRGPATQPAKGYASLFKKTLRKGLFSSFLYVLNIGKKGSIFKDCQQFRKKGLFFLGIFTGIRVIFWCFKSAF